jgi:hypothetical protein
MKHQLVLAAVAICCAVLLGCMGSASNSMLEQNHALPHLFKK